MSDRTPDTCSLNIGVWGPRGHRNKVGLQMGQLGHFKSSVTCVSIVRAEFCIPEGRSDMHTTKKVLLYELIAPEMPRYLCSVVSVA